MAPEVGVILSVDPVTAHSNPIGAFKRYRYGNRNPYRYTDSRDYTGAQKFRVMFMRGLVPFGTLSDAPGEPGYERAVTDHLRNKRGTHTMGILGEIGGAAP